MDRRASKPKNPIAEAMRATLTSPNTGYSDPKDVNVVDSLGEIADSIRFAAKHLGTGDASTPLGAIEYLGKTTEDAGESIAEGLQAIAHEIGDLASAVSRVSLALDHIAKAIEVHG